jgi:hypothetical protein
MPVDSNQSTEGGIMKYPILLAIVVLAGLAQSAYAADPAFVILEYKTMNFKDCISATDKIIAQRDSREWRIFRTKILSVTEIIADNGNLTITCSQPDQKFLVQMQTPTG